MLLSRLGPRITLFMTLAAVGVTLGGVLLSYYPVRQSLLNQGERRIRVLADAIHYTLDISSSSSDLLSLRRLVEKCGSLPDVSLVAVLDLDGTVRAASRPDPDISPELVLRAMEDNLPVTVTRNGHALLVTPLHGPVYSPVFSDVSGVLYLDMDLGPMLDELQVLYGSILAVVALLVGLMSLWAILLLRRQVIARLELVADGLGRVRSGDLSFRLPLDGSLGRGDEIGDLARHFNAMTENLDMRTLAQQRAEKELQVAYSALEEKVRERTAELAEANERLSAQMEERRQAEWRLKEHQIFLTTVLDGIQAAIFVFDPQQGRMVSSSSAAQSLVRMDEETIVASSCSAGVQVAFVAEGRTLNLLCPEWGEKNTYLEGVVHLEDGRTFPASRQLLEIFVDGQEHLAQIVFDITERKNLERRLGMAQKLESIGLLAAGIAHEINTPVQYVGDSVRFVRDSFKDLAGLLDAYAALIARAGESCPGRDDLRRVEEAEKEADLEFLRDEVPKACGRALDGLDRVARIVQAMKNFSHPGGDEKKPTDINKAIQNTVIVARNEWKYAAEVETELSPDLPLISCYAGDINQVLLNMLVNASHAIAEKVGDGGDKGLIRISTTPAGEFVEIRIADTGAGIPRENLERIFDPFFTTKPVGKGTGQGLTIAHDIIVNKHGGSIDVESEVGVGTAFILRLPLEPPEKEAT
ncbi:ATP-binding protein [Desulfovibrio aminophilus]|nr:ATP-binding protein [Desulfovibrio aminophilus]MCM0754855.1 ATP-binding protein [Desulfovibrio aminophilus]